MKDANLPRGQGNTSQYVLGLKVPSNNAAADGIATNTAKATLTLDSKAAPGQAITFSIVSGSATFGNGKQQIDNQMTLQDGSVDVPFSDAIGETHDIVAWMTNNTVVKSNAASYSFAQITHKIETFPVLDCTPADGKSINRILVAATNKSDGSVDKSYSDSVLFSTTDMNITFVGANDRNPQCVQVSATAGYADASFVCSSSVGSSAYKTTIVAALGDNSAHSTQQNFTFVQSSSDWFQLSYVPPYSGTMQYMNTTNTAVNVIVGLSAGNAAYFSSGGVIINDKICKTLCAGVNGNQYTGYYITVVCPNPNDKVELTVSAPDTSLSPMLTPLPS